MFKGTLAVLVTMLMFMGSTGIAGGGGGGTRTCDRERVPGSYVRNNTVGVYIDQLILGSDGTAYWYQSTSFDFVPIQPSFIPQVGSWKCLSDGNLLVTTIGTDYDSVSGHLEKSNNSRTTQKLSVVDNDTLLLTHRIFTNIPLLSDPLGPGVVGGASCTPLNPCSPFPYKRVKPKASDIP